MSKGTKNSGAESAGFEAPSEETPAEQPKSMSVRQVSAPAANKPAVPAGYEEVADDLVGYWDPEHFAMIHVIPREAKLFDSSQDETKPSVLIFCKLVDSAIVVNKEGQTKTLVEAQPGDMVGIWGKAGMRQKMMVLANRDCYVSVSGTKDVGKKEPMTTFSIMAKPARPSPLPLVEDRRDKSRRAETWWHNADGSAKRVGEYSDDDIPI